ncbi:hypothetical protein ERIN107935_04495 [Erysipelothrix inopinata]|nr:hypothetical protein [Erysipelothrix inopinata]
MEPLDKVILDALLERLTETQKYSDELYGYRDNLPEYRIFKRMLYADYIDSNGDLIKNSLLNRPLSVDKGLSYDSFVELRLHTGLLYLPSQMDELRKDEIEEVLYKVIEDIYDNQIHIVSARMIIDETMIQSMYKEIADRFKILDLKE